eukprot:scaffold17715_cov87-Skeletonema_dohrnii-CCMP3373.AAC.1
MEEKANDEGDDQLVWDEDDYDEDYDDETDEEVDQPASCLLAREDTASLNSHDRWPLNCTYKCPEEEKEYTVSQQ